MTDQRLYQLLPAYDQLRDTEAGGPLQALLGVIGDQVCALETGIGQLYDDWFIETCQDWLVPYFAELVGVALGPAITVPATGAPDPVNAARRRSLVANAIRDRRAKGTLTAIERFAADATGWPGRAIEFAWQVAATQSARHPGTGRGGTVPIGDPEAMDEFGTPFSTVPQTVDTRRICSHRTVGTGNLPSVGLVAWRLVADGVNLAPARCVNDGNHFTFDALGHDTQLCVLPAPRLPGQRPASNLDVPAPIGRAALDRRLEDYYGEARSLCVFRGHTAVDRAGIVVTDLTRWRHRLAPHQVAVDPVLGRIAFPADDVPEAGVRVTYRRLTVGGIGGGQYSRTLPAPDAANYSVSMTGRGVHRGVAAAYAAWRSDQASGHAGAQVTIEILDDGVYEERLHFELGPGESLAMRAADGHRPVLCPVDEDTDSPESLRITGLRQEGQQRGRRTRRAKAAGPAPDVVFDGVWIARHPVELAGHLGTVTFRHCTLVPTGRGRPGGGQVSLRIAAMPCAVQIESSVTGRLQVVSPETGFDPVPLAIADSIIDPGQPGQKVIEGPEHGPAWVRLSLLRTTLLGGADVREVDVVCDSIIAGRFDSARTQAGQVLFSYLPEGSRTPRRTSCQPDGVLAEVDDAIARDLVPPAERETLRQRAAARVRPHFDSARFGAPAYGRLSDSAAPELTRGARDEGELGSYHDLWLSYRAAQLRSDLPAYAPMGMDIGALFAT